MLDKVNEIRRKYENDGYVRALLSDSDFDSLAKGLDPTFFRKSTTRLVKDGEVLLLSFYRTPLTLSLNAEVIE